MLLTYFGIAIAICSLLYQIIFNEIKELKPVIFNAASYNVIGRMLYFVLIYLVGIAAILLYFSFIPRPELLLSFARFIALYATAALILLWFGFMGRKIAWELFGYITDYLDARSNK